MIKQIKQLIQEERKIKEAQLKLNARENKLYQRTSKIKCGHYVIDGEIWEVKYDSTFRRHELVFRGEAIQEA